MCRSRQRGFGAIAAIMILVILAALSAAVVTLASVQADDAVQDLAATRAYFAAQAGIEWGAFQALKASSCAASTDIGAIDGIAVTVGCELTAAAGVEAGSGAIYLISATACAPPAATQCPGATGSAHYVERRLVAIVQ